MYTVHYVPNFVFDGLSSVWFVNILLMAGE